MAKDEYVTDDNGQLMEPASTGDRKRDLHFQVFHVEYPGEGASYYVKPYKGNNQMVVEKVEKDNAQFIRAYNNMNPVNRFTGIMMMIVSRGEIVYTSFNSATNQLDRRMDDYIAKKVSPGARLIAFYVDTNDGEIVADSTKFAVDPICRGKPLTLTTAKSEVYPGGTSKLTVTGPSDMWVGFNVMDKALLLLNSDNVLKHNTIFKALESHDLGCGAGSGQTSEDMFKNAGLTILTNANADKEALKRTDEHCDIAKLRRRRSISTLKCPTENGNCCIMGEELAVALIEWQDYKRYHTNTTFELNPRDDCLANVKALRRNRHITHTCVVSMFRFCSERITAELRDQGLESRSIFDDDDQYKKDINALGDLSSSLRKRSHFETSFFFSEHQLENGVFNTSVKYRDSITEWSVQAIGISKTGGACIAESVDVKTFKPFFIQLDLPYKATRYEHFNIKATIFNYDKEVQQANVYLKGADGLCYGTSPGTNSKPTLVELEPNSAKTVSFSVIPLVAGDIPITVSALVSSVVEVKYDFIEKKLHVVNEGIMETRQIHACLDPNKQMEACVNSKNVKANEPLYGTRASRIYDIDLTLPAEALTGTGSATAYIESNIMGAVVATLLDGVDKLFEEPTGCGEQTMISLAPIVYGMSYLKQVGKETPTNEEQGTKWIKQGILHESSTYQKPDGSYAIWRRSPASVWLTAFVAKVFCQAEKIVDGLFIQESIQRTLGYIANVQKRTGYFKDDHPVHDWRMQGVLGKGDSKADPSLTAFVLIALQECSERTKAFDEASSNATGYLERLPIQNIRRNKYMLAITTYAFALSNSAKKGELKGHLLASATERDGMLYWSDHRGNAADVETTAYALLAFLKFDDIRTSGKIVTWLTDQRKASGSFHTTQDTVVALQALAEYSVRTYNPEVNLDIEIKNGHSLQRVSVTNDNALLQKVIPELLVKGQNNKFKVTVSGSGTARMNIELRWNRKALKNETCYFDVSSIEIDKVNPDFAGSSPDRFLIKDEPCDVCGRCPGDDERNNDNDIDYDDIINIVGGRKKREAADATPQKCVVFEVRTVDDVESLMSIVKVNLETGVKAIEVDFKELMKNGVIDRYEMPKDGESFVIFYIDKISPDPKKFIFRLEDHFQGSTASRQPATVVVYDYYKPEKKCIKSYSIGENHGQEVAFRCDDNSEQCECLQSQCSSPVDKELFDYTIEFSKYSSEKRKKNTKPYELIAQYACNFEKANFAYDVTISATKFDGKNAMKYATAVINNVILKGKENQHEGDEITLEWKLMCRHPDLKSGKQYIIVGKDPTLYNGDGDNEEARYEIMGTTMVIDPSYKPIMQTVMRKFGKYMKDNNGCLT